MDDAAGPVSHLAAMKLRDPRAMRALAHPLRLQLLAELRVRGPQSVGMLSDVVDEAPGSVSYHMGKLAEFGFVQPAPEHARDRRERWWRAAHAQTSWIPAEDQADPERRAASGLLRRSIAQRYAQVYEAYLAAEPAMDPDWVRAATAGDSFLHLTLDETAQLKREIDALVTRWEARGGERDERDGTQTVALIYQLFRRPQ